MQLPLDTMGTYAAGTQINPAALAAAAAATAADAVEAAMVFVREHDTAAGSTPSS
jgi:hypothetical protein